MTHKRSPHARKAGLPPGTLVHTGNISTEKCTISVTRFAADMLDERFVSIDQIPSFDFSDGVNWINVNGVNHTDVIQRFGDFFELHPLILEDIVNVYQRPKLEGYESCLFIVLKMLSYDETVQRIDNEQVSFILRSGVLITFQEREGDVFDAVRERIRTAKGRIRTKGTDYLLYALMDAIVDHYFLIVERFSETIETLEDKILLRSDPQSLEAINDLRRDLIVLRKSVWPLRDMINILQRGEYREIEKQTLLYMRDLYDHTVHVIDSIETSRELIGGLMDMYMSNLSIRMNETMKVLTSIATIFIPLTFIAGIYGMNFSFMPELQWHYGYFAVLGAMAVLGVIMGIYFKCRKWL
ncbi:magnesium/cobalt transporter CorA [bacterium]|nr:magnesium/cobalt transporter CorA [bacterium]